ncbi:uncharacterized protein LOC126830288 [Patella vulgata]|uniref:uncharacterized protein LOC126830288 n=1 Tax=Patella vulgata TaxID=6465 RepID=UPI00217F992B|nr:uncharacterized protein LOC126830288 [Patella vulgata]
MIYDKICGVHIVLVAIFTVVGGCVLWQNDAFTQSYTFSNWNLISGPFGEESLSFVGDPAGTGETVLRNFYKNGSYSKTSYRGVGFYAENLAEGRICVKLSYDLYFEPNFDFVRGGKLPGLWGGSTRCSGGRDALDCFTTRYMWRSHGNGEVYAYIPDNQTSDFCTSSDVHCNFQYGNSLGRGSWKFAIGQWLRLEQEVKLNDPSNHNGYVKVWLNGTQVYERMALVFRNHNNIKIDGITFSTFFGGSDESWASTVDTYTYYKNFQLSTCGG